jgi:hypothetical protein
VGSRERKRAARRKRKRRGARARSEQAPGAPPAEEARNGAEPAPATDESPSQRRNREAREALEPLREDERPAVVTVAAVICTLVVVASVLGYALWDPLRPDEPRPAAGGVVVFLAIVGPMAWGLWKARYWAVLGFQTVLLFVVVISAVGFVSSLSVLLAIGNLALMAAAGALFYFMIKACARIQMPSRLPRE